MVGHGLTLVGNFYIYAYAYARSCIIFLKLLILLLLLLLGDKIKRAWRPNIVNTVVYSEILDKRVKFKIAASELRKIDRMGGLDNYLLRSKDLCEFGKLWKTAVEEVKKRTPAIFK